MIFAIGEPADSISGPGGWANLTLRPAKTSSPCLFSRVGDRYVASATIKFSIAPICSIAQRT